MSDTAPAQEFIVDQQNWLRSVLIARVADPHVVDDLVSEVTRDALALGDRWDEIKTPGPWLYRVAVRKVLQYRRAQQYRRNSTSRFLDEPQNRELACEWMTPLDHLEKLEFRNLVRHALSKLNGRDREILLLKYVHDWSYDQISTNLGIDKTKIAWRLRNARMRLRRLLNHLVENEDDETTTCRS